MPLFAPLVLSLLLAGAGRPDSVEIEMLTHAEIYDAIHKDGKTTVLVYNGGTEQRGPQCVLGGHTLMARKTVEAIARGLGHSLAAPVLPFSPTGVDEKHPGAVALPADVFQRVNEAAVDSMVKNGFKYVVLMGDHGGGQRELKELAEKMEAKYAAQGVHVFYCNDVYDKANNEFNEWLAKNGKPSGGHASIIDTSEMLYLGGDSWVRRDKITFGDPVLPRGQQRDPSAPRINNGITGDARGSSPELGKKIFDMKVQYAIAEISKWRSGLLGSGAQE
jgi:creatinine amidohydrolase/Fe(II)-dependent formamide hydrolase-like protein